MAVSVCPPASSIQFLSSVWMNAVDWLRCLASGLMVAVLGQVPARAIFSRDEEEFTFTKVELEVMRSCPSGEFCQTFRDAHCNMCIGRYSLVLVYMQATLLLEPCGEDPNNKEIYLCVRFKIVLVCALHYISIT